MLKENVDPCVFQNYGIEYHLEGTELVRLNALMRFVETELKPAVVSLTPVEGSNGLFLLMPL